MPRSAAERARLYRAKMREDSETHTAYLQKERERYQKRKEKGKIQTIADMTARDKRHERRKWRHRKRDERRKKSQPVPCADTPPPTPSPGPFPVHLKDSSERRKTTKRKVKRDRSKAYRTIEQLEKELKIHKRLEERFRKRLYRNKVKQTDANSPRTKTHRLTKGQKVTASTRRIILFHNVLVEGLRRKYKDMKSEKQKQILTKAITSNLLTKYRLQKDVRESLEISYKRTNSKQTSKQLIYTRKIQRNSIVRTLKQSVEDFLSRDDNSRVKAGKKSTVTQKKEKRQIRLLNDSLKNLYLKYKAENVENKISYAMFCRLRPFHIRQPTAGDRQTCLCKRHENLKFKSDKLKQLGLLQSSDVETVVGDIVCSVKSKECMYRACHECKEKSIRIDTGEVDTGTMVEFYEWKTKRVSRDIPKEGESSKVTVMTVKEKEKCTIETLVNDFNDELTKCCPHLYNISHQYIEIRQLKEKMSEEDILIHVDFSENYACKYESEIQSVHFGASQRQISLHTGVLYTKGMTVPFCSLSDCLKHSPTAIWGHLTPVLEYAKEKFKSAKNVFFLSDGPTTQYRNKQNFYLLSKIPFKMDFQSVNWNFTEAGHGKGAPDGIGAVVKREADRIVSHGKDVTGAERLRDMLEENGTKLTLFLVTEEDIQSIDRFVDDKLSPVSGTMKIHQVL